MSINPTSFEDFYLQHVAGTDISRTGMIPPLDDDDRGQTVLDNFKKVPELAAETLQAMRSTGPNQVMQHGVWSNRLNDIITNFRPLSGTRLEIGEYASHYEDFMQNVRASNVYQSIGSEGQALVESIVRHILILHDWMYFSRQSVTIMGFISKFAGDKNKDDDESTYNYFMNLFESMSEETIQSRNRALNELDADLRNLIYQYGPEKYYVQERVTDWNYTHTPVDPSRVAFSPAEEALVSGVIRYLGGSRNEIVSDNDAIYLNLLASLREAQNFTEGFARERGYYVMYRFKDVVQADPAAKQRLKHAVESRLRESVEPPAKWAYLPELPEFLRASQGSMRIEEKAPEEMGGEVDLSEVALVDHEASSGHAADFRAVHPGVQAAVAQEGVARASVMRKVVM